MNTAIQMTDCEVKTTEWAESFPSVELNAKFCLLKMKSIESINLQRIKDELTKIVADNVIFKENRNEQKN